MPQTSYPLKEYTVRRVIWSITLRHCCRPKPLTGVDRQHESREALSLYPLALQLARALRLEFVGRAT
jgi:hypothetical protein